MHRILGVVLAAVLAAPASATIIVEFSPSAQDVDIALGTTTVDIVADIPESDAIVGWGLDLATVGTSAALASVAVNEVLFDAVFAPDGDDLAALVPSDSLFGDDIVLATLSFNLIEEGLTSLSLSYTLSDLTEGFPLDPALPGDFAAATFVDGSINVIPEPATLLLVALGAIAARRRS